MTYFGLGLAAALEGDAALAHAQLRYLREQGEDELADELETMIEQGTKKLP